MKDEFERELRRYIDPYTELTAVQLDQLWRHYELMVKWNRRINLTRVDDIAGAVRLHYAESLFLGFELARHLPSTIDLADYGSGAGFPGYPLAVLHPHWQMRLIESHQRKSVFLSEVSRGLPNISVVPHRVESLTEKFDLIVSRAVDAKEVLNNARAPAVGLLTSETIAINEAGWETVLEIGLPWNPTHSVVVLRRNEG